ncbi:anaerobic ribonucleoside-triphosphate reductase activating protein [Methanococcoides methylutens]|uniref:Ribonucleotide reductase of class III (Anaerobic), activating protein n=1 Tax=Methanococcoides methylutens MM1 TaxID=1434104 RepID=A0A0E3WZ32_METMT|nr:anaerobic ribonucleoside-triphosphate reductase activating protein [Methanococcoides methylutens]AKB84374.1 Ribonucleotide reductase of class III (anaerobic), activating protein [Methanococcoides methylutens MM1]
MKVNFGEIIPISTVDWHGKASVVLFLRNCPYRCPYCQNYEILTGSDMLEAKELEAKIDSSSLFVSSVVFSGGEPLVQKKAVMHLAAYAKKKKLLVGIHTNGYYPEVVEELIDGSLVDKFFIDVKAPLDDPDMYGKAIGYGDDPVVPDPSEVVEKVNRTIAIVTDRKMEYELRTTAIRGFVGDPDDIAAIASSIVPYVSVSDAPYVIQQGLPAHSMREDLRDIVPFSREEMLELAGRAHEFVDNVWIRTKEGGNEQVNFE